MTRTHGTHRMRRLLAAWPWALALLCLPVCAATAVERSALEAAIVFNVLQFVEWPGEVAQPDGATLTLCFKGSSPLLPSALQLDGRPIRRMTLHVIRLDGVQHQCQAVYLDSAQGEAEARTAIREPALVIGASDYRPAASPSIQLLFVEGRLAFDIDKRKAQLAGLVISSRLLRLARTVIE